MVLTLQRLTRMAYIRQEQRHEVVRLCSLIILKPSAVLDVCTYRLTSSASACFQWNESGSAHIRYYTYWRSSLSNMALAMYELCTCSFVSWAQIACHCIFLMYSQALTSVRHVNFSTLHQCCWLLIMKCTLVGLHFGWHSHQHRHFVCLQITLTPPSCHDGHSTICFHRTLLVNSGVPLWQAVILLLLGCIFAGAAASIRKEGQFQG